MIEGNNLCVMPIVDALTKIRPCRASLVDICVTTQRLTGEAKKHLGVTRLNFGSALSLLLGGTVRRIKTRATQSKHIYLTLA